MNLLRAISIILFSSGLFSLENKPNYKIIFHTDIGSRSHVKPILEIGHELIQQNHNFIYASSSSNRRYLSEHPSIPFIDMGKSVNSDKFRDNSLANRTQLEKTNNYLSKMLTASYSHNFENFNQLIIREQPDLIICDLFVPHCRDVANLNQIPLVSGLQTTDGFGIDTPAYITESADYGQITTDKLSIWDRIKDKMVNKYYKIKAERLVIDSLNNVRKEFGVPNVNFKFGDFRQSLAIANTFVGLEAAVSMPPNIKMVGPIKSASLPIPLNDELYQFMNNHDKVLYIAFGSFFKLTTDQINNLLATCFLAIEKGDINGVIWGLGPTQLESFPKSVTVNNTSYGTESFVNNENNDIKLLRWAPQVSILAHKNTKLYISHGGLESIFESILSKTPMLCMALSADQPRNARKLEVAGIGKYIDRNTIKPLEFSNYISDFITDKSGSIKSNLDRMYALANSKANSIQTPVNIILDYIELAKICRPNHPPVEFGELPCEMLHLGLASDKLNYLQANQLDAYGLVGFGLLGSAISLIYFLLRVLRLVKGYFNAAEKTTKRD